MAKKLTKREQYRGFLKEKFMSSYSEEQLSTCKSFIQDKDKIQWRTQTAEELGLSLDEITVLAQITGIPQFEAVDVGRRFTRTSFEEFLENRKDQLELVIADELNLSQYSFSLLKKHLKQGTK